MNAWSIIPTLIRMGKLTSSDATLVHTLFTDLRQIGGGKDLSREQILELLKEALPVVEVVAGTMFPGADKAIAIAATVLSFSRPMTFDEEQAWMARASASSPGGGA